MGWLIVCNIALAIFSVDGMDREQAGPAYAGAHVHSCLIPAQWRTALTHSSRPSAQESLYSDIDRRSAYYRATRRAEQEAAHPPPQPLLTPPNILTLLRVVLVPVFVASWYSTGKGFVQWMSEQYTVCCAFCTMHCSRVMFACAQDT